MSAHTQILMPKDKLIGEGKKKPLDPSSRDRKLKQKKDKLKNKKQRTSSRAALLRSKDPKEMLKELFELDKQEYILSQNPSIEENIVKEKRRKLKDNFDKLLTFLQRDNKEKYEEVRRLQHEYDTKRRNIQRDIFMANKQKEIDLLENHPFKHMLPHIPLPNQTTNLQSYQTEQLSSEPYEKKDLPQIPALPANILPPGPPPGLPPQNAQPIPKELLNIEPIMNPSMSMQSRLTPYYFYDPLPPPPPPPRKKPTPTPSTVQQQDYAPSHISSQPMAYELNIAMASTPTILTADPKLRDLQAEVTKLIPISVMRKREETKPLKLPVSQINHPRSETPELPNQEDDDEYSNFINEVNKL